MHAKSQISLIRKTLYGIMLLGMVLSNLGTGSLPVPLIDKMSDPILLPDFKLPYDGSLKIGWTGGPHQYSNLITASTYPTGEGSGLDFSNGTRFEVLAMASGEVIDAGCNHHFGCQVAIQHEIGGTVLIYGHLTEGSLTVKVGNLVVQGQILGKAGDSGTDNIHLHIEFRRGRKTDNGNWICNHSCLESSGGLPYGFGGDPYGWDDGIPFVDGYNIFSYIVDSEGLKSYNYDGSAVWGITKVLNNFHYNDSGGPETPFAVRVNIYFSCLHPDDINSNCELPNNHDNPGTLTKFATEGRYFSFSHDNRVSINKPNLTSISDTNYLISTNIAISNPPPQPSGIDNALFISDITIPDGKVVSPGQALTKTWRVKNVGTSTWGSGYQLVFTGGDQMGAPSAVDVPVTAPGQEVNISVIITTPNQNGNLTGKWSLRHDTTYFGPPLWVKLTVNTQATPTPPPDPIGWDVNIVNVEYPPVVTPGQTFRPKVTVKVNQGQLLESRGDLLRNTDGNLYGAWPHVAVVGTVNAGQNYLFEFYANNPMTAPSGEGTYESKWQVWRNGNWSGPEITIRFDVRNGGGTRPTPPALSDPGNWSVFAESSPPALCVNASAGVQYFFQIYESHDIPDSGWIDTNCWTPPSLGPYTYKWHAKARNISTALESDWSESRNFSLYSTQLSMDNLEFSPGSPSSAERIQVYTCVHGFGDIGLGLKIEANTATDGSASGDWYWIHHLGKFCYDHSNTSTWPTFENLPIADGDHLIRAVGFGPQGQTMVKTAIYHLDRRRPNGPVLINPSTDAWVNNRLITFQWNPAWRVNSYRFVAGTNPDPTINPLVDQVLTADTTSYQFNFVSAYPDIYWRVFAINEIGSSDTVGHFGIDQLAPVSSVTAFSPSVSTETAFPVTWGGSDDRSGVRWYDIQYRDGNRSDSAWADWISQTTTISSIFIGQAGHTYYFRSRSLDVAGNLEAWPATDGDTSIVIDLAAQAPTPWWDTGYGYKRNLLVLNNDGNALASGYPIHIHFDAGTTPSSTDLFTASQSTLKGDDFRIVYNNTTELSRFVQVFNSGQIDIWFDLQTDIAPSPASNASSYQLYYGNPSAVNPPADINNVFPPPDEASTVGLWHFSDQSGSTFADKSGNGNNGILYNGGWAANGKFGSAAVFNGSSTYAEIPSSSLFNLNNFTIEGWFKLYNNGTQLLLRRRMTTNTEEAYRLEIRDWKFVGNIRGAINVQSQTQLVQGLWYHLAFTYDGTTARVFVNGNLETSMGFGTGVPAGTGPVILGRNSANSDYMNGQVQGLRISNTASTSFPYGGYGNILNEPSVAAGDANIPPVTGSPDLALLNLATYPNPDGGILIEAVVMNQGNLSTQNGFYTDLYLNHVPTGAEDYSGGIRFWVNDQIAPGQTATLTTVVTDLSTLLPFAMPDIRVSSTFTESSGTLYAQTDSAGLVQETDKQNNIYSSGIQICTASLDSFENDSIYTNASLLAVGDSQIHNFNVPGDKDWIKFNAVVGKTYAISTSGLGASNDTYLSLSGPDGITLLASNDDNNDTLASQITWQPTIAGTYYILVNHWNPSVGGCGTQYTISLTDAPVVAIFADVPSSYWSWQYIERLYNSGITSGCSTVPLNYCPTNSVTRAQMAIFLLRGMHGSAYTPPAATGTKFNDVPLGSFGAAWIEQLAVEGITSGCGGGNYCPNSAVTRAQMAIFLVRAKHGIAFVPPTATGIFTDVPVGSFGADFIEQLAADAITSGCGPGIYCPAATVNRDSMAVFLVRTFNLP
ncbi:MAG: peptidoglycan DD-metalloendopeptidase family protein [Chloroflexi bacterium]|nr:peptidoglycan DD-metalloendopeptidase family protein [Chloroflexota bacterium]